MKAIHAASAPPAIGPYSQAIFKNDTLYMSGLIGFDLSSGSIPTHFPAQVQLIFQHARQILAAANMSLTSIVQATVYLKDISHFEEFNQLYGTFFSQPYPARVTLEVSRLPKNAAIEIAFIAMR